MAFEVVNPLACFWRKAGLRNLLFNNPPQIEYAPQNSAPKPAAVVEKAAKSPADVPRYSRSRPAEEKFSATAAEKAPGNSVSPLWQPLQPAQMPENWRTRLEKTKPGLAAWTYADLALDLEAGQHDDIGLQGRQLRRNFLQSLIRDLRQPGGTHTFWPTRVLVAGVPAPDSEAFWSGLDHLGSRILFVFGQQALEDCALPDTSPKFYRKCIIFKLDDLNKLASMPNGKQKALVIMQGAFNYYRLYGRR